jgi:bifunctional non-homologous end joining protein LigD
MIKIEEKPIIWNIEGYELQITHPNKIYWPKDRFTKMDVMSYYKRISSIILPYFKNRPATLHYFPRGIEGFSFYKRNFEITDDNGKLFRTASYKEKSKNKTIQVPLIDSTAGLLWFASKGGFEFHLWSSKMPNYAKPDIAIFDLDTNENNPFEDILKVSLNLKELLISIGLKSYPKTSGGTGMHVYVPIVPKYSFEHVREWVKKISLEIERQYPKLITTQRDRGKTHTSDKVTIDYLQNVVSRNTVAPYSIRGYSGAYISTPLSWEEVKKGGLLPKDFTIKNVVDRVEKLGDLFSGVLTKKQSLEIF